MSKSEAIEKQELHLKYLFEYGVDFKNRIILLNPDSGVVDDDHRHEIGPGAFSLIDAALSEMEASSRKAVTIKIHSWGGCVKTAAAIVGRLTSSKCKIITEGYGTIESAATLILACGKERRISKFATFMHHEASYHMEGRHSQAKAFVKQAEIEEQMWASWMSTFSNKPKSFYLKQGVHVDAYWTPEQLLEYGIVDQII